MSTLSILNIFCVGIGNILTNIMHFTHPRNRGNIYLKHNLSDNIRLYFYNYNIFFLNVVIFKILCDKNSFLNDGYDIISMLLN